MKKNMIRLLAAIMALLIVLSLAACGGDSKKDDSSSAPESSSSAAADDAGANADGSFDTVKAFLDDPDTKAQLDQMIESMVGDDDTMSVDIEGTDDSLIYIFKYSDEALGDADVDALADALATAMEGQDSVFEGIASSISTVVNVDNPKVVVTYAKADGTEIYSQTFEAK